jgi:hypothetical protein
MGYRVLKYDCSATVERKQLLAPNESFTSLHVLQVPTGAEIEFAIGDGEKFPVFEGFSADFCPAEMAGLQLTSSAAVAGTLILVAWSQGGSSQGGV